MKIMIVCEEPCMFHYPRLVAQASFHKTLVTKDKKAREDQFQCVEGTVPSDYQVSGPCRIYKLYRVVRS